MQSDTQNGPAEAATVTGSSSQQQAEKRRRSSSRFRLLCAAAAVLAALTVTAAIMGKSFTDKLAPAHAQPSAAPSASAAGQPAQPTQPAQPASPFPTDDLGFVNSAARCDGTQTAMAIGRTQRSLVVICVNQHGSYEYRGVRISDQTPLTVPAETTSGGAFVAENEGVTYTVSSTQLLVTSGNSVINREPMIEYQQPHSSATPTGAAPATPAPASAPAR
jgi:hypothetical protein